VLENLINDLFLRPSQQPVKVVGADQLPLFVPIKSSCFISWSEFAGPYIVPARDCPYRAPTLNTKPSIAPRLRQCPNWRFPGVDSHAVNARIKARCTIHQPYQHFDKISATNTYNFRKRTIAAGVLDFWPTAGIP
jgi:hypothetical protein